MNAVRCSAIVLTAALGVSDLRAGLFQDLYRGLDVLATPSGFPVFPLPDGGFGNGQRQGRLRIVPDAAGRGYTLEFDRTFGVDTRGRPEVLDLGPYELELNGSMQATAGFTRRGYLVGNVDFTTSNLSYRMSNKSGLQDYELTGVLNVQQSMEVNQFGFYTLSLNVNNTNATLTQDGVIARNSEDVSFDVGPINIEGNIYFDALVGLLGAIGVDTSGLTALSPKSPIDRIADALSAEFNQATQVAGETYSADRARQLLASDLVTGPQQPDALVAPVINLIPEPGTLVLLALGGVTLTGIRRRA